MTVLHLESLADQNGKVNLGVMDVGVPGARVNVTLEVEDKLTQEQWAREMELVLEAMADVHLEAYPRTPMKDPWSED